MAYSIIKSRPSYTLVYFADAPTQVTSASATLSLTTTARGRVVRRGPASATIAITCTAEGRVISSAGGAQCVLTINTTALGRIVRRGPASTSLTINCTAEGRIVTGGGASPAITNELGSPALGTTTLG